MNTIGIQNSRKMIVDFEILKSIGMKAVMVLILIFSMNSVALAQNTSVKETREKVVQALKNNNIEVFVSTFSDPIDITLPDVENSYSKTQASMVMRDFLTKNKIKTFKVKQSGKSTAGAEFIIGEVVTEGGKKYEVYLLITLVDKKASLHLIEFELN